MNQTCPMCWRPLPDGAAGVTTLGVGQRPVITVHEGQCTEMALRTVRLVGKGALNSLRGLLAAKAPLASALLEEFAKRRRAERARVMHG